MTLPILLAAAVFGASAAPRPSARTAEAALRELEQYGTVPACRVDETIVEDGTGRPHAFGTPRPVERLAGKAPEILPYLQHKSRRVVLRAVQLACAAQGDEVPGALAQLADLYPCEEELVQAALAFGHGVRGTRDCWSSERKAPLFSPFFDLKQWSTKASAALAARLDKGDAAAFAEAVDGLDALDKKVAQESAAALAAVSTPQGYLALVLAADARSKGTLSPREFLLGAGGLALETMAKKAKVDDGEMLVRIVARSGPEEAPSLLAVAECGEVDHVFERAMAALRSPEKRSIAARAVLDRLAARMPSESRGEPFFKSNDLVRARDKKALRAWLDDLTRPRDDRVYAASGLAELGDPAGLELWASTEGLWPRELTDRKRKLEELSRRATGEAAEKAKALLEGPWAAVPTR